VYLFFGERMGELDPVEQAACSHSASVRNAECLAWRAPTGVARLVWFKKFLGSTRKIFQFSHCWKRMKPARAAMNTGLRVQTALRYPPSPAT
jgi:hypothetical protein